MSAPSLARSIIGGLPLPLDAVARGIADSTAAPIGLVTLVDGPRTRFVGTHGVGGRPGAVRRVPAAEMFCRDVVTAQAPVLIPDIGGDSRSPGGPDLSVRAYAGVPLRDRGGAVIGAVCALDVAPRRWTAEEVGALRGTAATLGVLPGVRDLAAGGKPRRREPELPDPSVDFAPLAQSWLVDAVPHAVSAVDAQGRIVVWNSAATELLGWTAEEALGRPASEFVVPHRSPAQVRAELAATHAAGPSPSSRHRRVWATTRDGREVQFEVAVAVVPGPNGPLVCTTAVDAVPEEEGTPDPRSLFLQALLDSLDTAVFACDADGHTVFGNPALQAMLELPDPLPTDAEAVAGTNLHDVEGRPLPREAHPTALALAGGSVRDLEIRLTRPGRPARTLVANAERIVLDAEVLGAVVALHDVTDQRRAQRFRECELAVSRALVEADRVTEAARQVVDGVARSLRWPHAELWLVDEVSEVLRPAASWTDGEFDREGVMSTQLASGQGLAGTVWHTAEPVWVADLSTEKRFAVEGAARRGLRTALAVPVRSAATVVGVLALYADTLDEDRTALTAHLSGVAAHLGQYLERRRAEELALQLARTKDDFLALVGHELRTPLTSITTYTQLLHDHPEAWESDGERLIGVIRRNTDSLTAIINDLLDLAGLESGHITIRPDATDLSELVRDAIDAVTESAARRSVTVRTDLPATAPLHGDGQRLRQMLDNLLSNAVKYSHEGGEVTVTLAEDGGVLTLSVADTGIGIPAEERDRLFQRFFRSSTAKDSGVPGTGLGLVVTRAIVERHGGRIVATHNDPGTTMVVRLPAG